MKKASRPRREQPNMDLSGAQPHSADQDENFSLDDIMNEFGGWSRHEPEGEPAPEGDVKSQSETVEPLASESDVAETKAEPDQNAEPAVTNEGQTEDKPKESVIWVYQPESEKQVVDLRQAQEARSAPRRQRRDAPPSRRPQPSQQTRQAKSARPTRSPKPEVEYPPADVLYKSLCKQARSLMVRKRLAALWCLMTMALTLLNDLQLDGLDFLWQGSTAAAIALALLIISVITAYDVLLRGLYNCLKLAFSMESLLAVAAVVFAIQGFISMEKGQLPYAAVLTIALWFALWGDCLQNNAKRRSLKVLLSMPEEPSAAVMTRGAWNGRDCIFRTAGSSEHFVTALEAPSVATVALRVYATAALLLSLALSLVLQFLRDIPFLSSWSAILAGSIPAAAFIIYWKPFAALTAALQKCGAVLCGWQGAKSLTGKALVAVEDTDLFAAAGVSMNGMKVFGDQNVSQVVGCTYAVIAASGCGLEPVFREVYANQNGRACSIDNFKRYEGGGVGAEIAGDVVLVGSIGFMQLMGVKMPEGTNVRQAVYCAMNGNLAAVFAIHYNPSAAVRSGLQTVLRGKGLGLLLATRDFILTPAVIRHKYKIPSDCMEYPGIDDRVNLSGSDRHPDGIPAALFSRESFLGLAEAVAGGRGLCTSVRTGVAVSLLGGVVGFAITLMLSFLGSFAVASALNLMLFTLLWTLPVLLLTAIAGKT